VSDATRPSSPVTSGPIDHPPLEPLRSLIARLEAARFPHALGGSGLLAALGLVTRVNDWDVTVEAGIDALVAACARLKFERFGNNGCHADHKLSFARERTELISEFAFFVPGGAIRIPVRVSATWNGLPVGSPTAWAAAYALLGELDREPRRLERAELLFGWLEHRTPETEVIDALLAQPLPAPLAWRIGELRKR